MQDAQRWSRIESLFDTAIELPGQQRERYLRTECADDFALLAEVEQLLEAAIHNADFLKSVGTAREDTPLLKPGTLVGEWRIGALLGRGGMGEVYLAERAGRDFEQKAALKLLTRLDSDDDRSRFAAERRILGRLQHPGIAHLLDGGEYSGMPYVVMEHVTGQRLDTYAATLPLLRRIDLFLQICAAVSHAHQHLIVHRDLKPSNIMVTAEGRIKLLDFGIAKHLDLTQPGDVTQVIRASPDYCAPEQLRGEAVSAATDVYALGVILHELLSGQRLWQLGGLPLMQALERLAAADVPLPSAVVADPAQRRMLRGDLDSIVLRALRADPQARYHSVDALADDLCAHLESRPVRARGGALSYRIGRTLRRHRWWFAGAAALFASLLVGLAGVIWQARETTIERDLARREAERADAVRQYLMLMFRTAGEQPQSESLTAKAVLDQAAARLQQQFTSDPTRYSEMLLALADLYYYLNDYTGARPLLTQLLDGGRSIEPAQRAMAQHDLAQIEFRENQAEAASELLLQAQQYWNTQPQTYRSELLTSRLLQSQLERTAGDPERALDTLLTALPERLAASGRYHRDTGVLINNLGIAYFQLGRNEQAIEYFEQAQAIWDALDQARSADALNTLNNWAAAELRRQQPQVAVEIFYRALALRRELYGPSAAMAALQSNLGKTLLQLQRADEALPLLQEAAAMAEQYAGADGVLTVAARLGLADALSATGAVDDAKAQLDALALQIQASYGDAHLLGALLEVSRARLAAAAGNTALALEILARAQSRFEALGPAGAPYLLQLEPLRHQWTGNEGGATSRSGAGAAPSAGSADKA